MSRLLWRYYRGAVERMPHVRRLVRRWRHVERFCPVDHFYSPVANVDEIRPRDARLFDAVPESIPGVDLNLDGQRGLLHQFAAFHADLPFGDEPRPGLRYYYRNQFFEAGDGVYLYCMLRHLLPKRYIEIGSGFSSCAALDTAERYLDGKIHFTFIDPDPHPSRLLDRAKPGDLERVRFITGLVQDVDPALFDDLDADDILFIDSSHVAKVGSDVNSLLFEVLPRLASGVVIHIHDVFYPFEYPRDWVYGGRSWNEAYLVRAFLQYNSAFDVICFGSYLERFARSELQRLLPTVLKSPSQSIWLRKR